MAMKVFRSMAPRFFTGFPDSKALRSDLAQNMSTLDYLIKTLDNYNPSVTTE